MDGPVLQKCFLYTADIARPQASEISDEESLKQPIAAGHSANWLLGHIISARSYPLRYVGARPVWSNQERERYRDGSDPIGAAGPGVVEFGLLVDRFELSQRRLLIGLSEMSEAALCAPSGYGDNSVLKSLLYFHFHETYHVGQLTMVAEALGKRSIYLSV